MYEPARTYHHYSVALLEDIPDENMPTQQKESDDSGSKSDDDDDTVKDISLRSINAVSAYEPFVQDARARVSAEMESMVLTGLKTLVSLAFR